MLEVFRQKILTEFWGIPDNKAIVAFAPGHYGFSGSIINHVIGLCKKRRRCIALQSIHRLRPSREGTTCWKQRDLGIHHHDLSRSHLLSDLFFPSSMLYHSAVMFVSRLRAPQPKKNWLLYLKMPQKTTTKTPYFII